MPRRAFFFPHSLEANLTKGGTPGRVPFDVKADLVDTIGKRAFNDAVRICADGYEPNVIGSSQEPCIFAGPLHVYSRIDSTRKDNCVKGTKLPLSHAVRPNDVIIYGKFEPKGNGPTDRVWIDTVMVVDRSEPWTTSSRAPDAECKNPYCTRAKKFTLKSPAEMAAKLSGQTPGASTAAYRFSLQDAESTGMHCCTQLGNYKIIVGKHAHDVDAVTNLMTSYVTLAEEHEGAFRPASIAAADLPSEWEALQKFLDTEVRQTGAGPKGAWIAEFPSFELAAALSAAIVAASGRAMGTPGTVAIPPVEPAVPVHRWWNATATADAKPV